MRECTILVTCDLPRDILITDFKMYVEDAVRSHGGQLHIYDDFSDKDLRNSMKVKFGNRRNQTRRKGS